MTRRSARLPKGPKPAPVAVLIPAPEIPTRETAAPTGKTDNGKAIKAAVISTTEIAKHEAYALLERIVNGESVMAEERLEVIRKIFAFSQRDWYADPELRLIYAVASRDGLDDGE